MRQDVAADLLQVFFLTTVFLLLIEWEPIVTLKVSDFCSGMSYRQNYVEVKKLRLLNQSIPRQMHFSVEFKRSGVNETMTF